MGILDLSTRDQEIAGTTHPNEGTHLPSAFELYANDAYYFLLVIGAALALALIYTCRRQIGEFILDLAAFLLRGWRKYSEGARRLGAEIAKRAHQ